MKQIRICFLGESFVNGTGDPECLGWTGRICVDANKKGADITYYNLGIRRETSTQLKERWLQEVFLRLPKEYDGRVVFCFGANDTVEENGQIRVSLTESIVNTREILNQAKELYPVLMVSPLPMLDKRQNLRIANLGQQFSVICQELNVPYLNVIPLLENSDIWMKEITDYDGAHPRANGYQILAEIVQSWEWWSNWFS
jgi:lysophospholipase L1-like esterase